MSEVIPQKEQSTRPNMFEPIRKKYSPTEGIQSLESRSSQNSQVDARQMALHQRELAQVAPQYGASFTRPIAEALQRCGVDVAYVNPVPIGEGANHMVYWYAKPETPEQVIKIGKPRAVTTMTQGREGEQQNIDIAKKYFPGYVAQTEVRTDPQNRNFHCVIQEAVRGVPVTNKLYKENPDVQRQLREIVTMNNQLYRQEKTTLDFVGMPGFVGWIKKQARKLVLRKSEFEVSNILVDRQGKLKIVDVEYFTFGENVGLKRKFLNFIGFFTNRSLMKHYFGLDIKRA